MNRLNELTKIKIYVAIVLVALGVFTWAGFTGTRLLGDDDEQVNNGYRSSYGRHGYTRFYHK